MSYKTFKRSARNFDEFATARKTTVDTGLTEAEARQRCHEFNTNRTSRQIALGTKLEYTKE